MSSSHPDISSCRWRCQATLSCHFVSDDVKTYCHLCGHHNRGTDCLDQNLGIWKIEKFEVAIGSDQVPHRRRRRRRRRCAGAECKFGHIFSAPIFNKQSSDISTFISQLVQLQHSHLFCLTFFTCHIVVTK